MYLDQKSGHHVLVLLLFPRQYYMHTVKEDALNEGLCLRNVERKRDGPDAAGFLD